MFSGEKKTTFWIGLVALGYSISQFFQAFWLTIYLSGIYPNENYETSFNLTLFRLALEEYLPNIVAGIIFLVIGLYLMKVGVKKQPISNPEVNQTP
ncbi:MAG: hypothetical protein ABSA79_05375 [Candidatus Bathyarchaeia archaeon]|jgi:xanthine/uracil permease